MVNGSVSDRKKKKGKNNQIFSIDTLGEIIIYMKVREEEWKVFSTIFPAGNLNIISQKSTHLKAPTIENC